MNPKVGEVYERDGKQREVLSVGPRGIDIVWCRPGREKQMICWMSSWQAWAQHAALVKAVPND